MKVKLLKNIRYGSSTQPHKVGDYIEIHSENLDEFISKGIIDAEYAISETPEEEEVVEEEVEDTLLDEVENITRREIIAKLSALGVEHNPRGKKEDLYELLISVEA